MVRPNYIHTRGKEERERSMSPKLRTSHGSKDIANYFCLMTQQNGTF